MENYTNITILKDKYDFIRLGSALRCCILATDARINMEISLFVFTTDMEDEYR
jgi:hypothetical protein